MADRNRDNRASLRQAGAITLGFLLTLVLGDRLLAHAKLPRVYGSTNECRWKCDLYDQSAMTPDVVFVGSSYSFYGISPRVIDAVASATLGQPVRSFNLASSAASLFTESLTIRRMLESGRYPRVAYLGISPRGVATTRREWLVSGMRGLGDARDASLTLTSDAEMIWETLRMATLASNFQIKDCQLITQRTLLGAPLDPVSKTEHDELGWARWVGAEKLDIPPWDNARTALADGVDGPAYAPDNLNGRALRRAIADLQNAGITVRLIEMPIASTARLDPDSPECAAYEAFVRAVEQDTGLTLLRTPDDVIPDAYFFDHLHLTGAGAELFSQWLAADVANTLRQLENPEVRHASAATAGR
ncbi:MAG: hypothetical protein H6817_04245 [Phycisphaerales bacterium]|nr:hypothetical protein [Phycisphaerales bacterium]